MISVRLEDICYALELCMSHEEWCAVARVLRNATVPTEDMDALESAWEDTLRRVKSNCALFDDVLTNLSNQKHEAEEEKRKNLADKVAEIAADAREDCNQAGYLPVSCARLASRALFLFANTYFTKKKSLRKP